MNLKSNELEELSYHAGNYMKLDEIAIILEVDLKELVAELKNKESDVYKSFHKSRLIQISKINENIFKLASSGSPVAQNLALDIIRETKAKEIDYNL